MAEAAQRDGKLGWVRCPSCVAREAWTDTSPEITVQHVEDAVRGASRALPGGPLIIMVLIVNEVDGVSVVHCGSSTGNELVRRGILETELARYSS